MRINLQTAELIDVHNSNVGRMNSGPALTPRAIELLKHQAAKQPSRVRIPSEIPNNCRTAFNHDPYLYYCSLARIGGRRKVTYPLDHIFSVDSKKLNFVLIAFIFMEILGNFDRSL
jgi:hypothetical protein